MINIDKLIGNSHPELISMTGKVAKDVVPLFTSPPATAATQVELEAVIERLNEALNNRNQSISFQVDSSTGLDIIRVINQNTGELIRQLPSPQFLAAIENMDTMLGLIFNEHF